MKSQFLSIGALLVCSVSQLISFESMAQDNTLKYRRSSLSMILMENSSLGKSRDLVVKSYEANPFPDKYNKHNSGAGSMNFDNMKLTNADYLSSGFYKDTLKKVLEILKVSMNPLKEVRYLNADSSMAVIEPTKNELLNIYVEKYIKDNNLAKTVAGSWFNRTADGKMNWELIKERGQYSASAEDLEQASTAASETDFLMDFELIGNTYCVFNYLEFNPNEPVAALVRDVAKTSTLKELAGKPDILLQKALAKLDDMYEKTKEGYTVKCNSYLYKLDWDSHTADNVKNYFFNDNVDGKAIWDTTNIFKLSSLGKTTSSSIVTFKIGETRTEEQIIDLQIRKTMDKALAKLQKEYVQFRPVAPISSVGPLTAKIGLKEGLEPGQTFEILEMGKNDLGMPVFISKGKVTVDKKAPIWDNTQGAEVQTDEAGNPLPEYATFTGGKGAEAGFNFLRLVK